ncbi:MAG: hypothetical protein RLZZ22_1274, partial [Pseudomonadota bacterium]
HDYEAIPVAQAERLISELRASLPALAGQTMAGQTIAWADDFAYTDPVDGSRSERQGVRVVLADSSRVVLRLSGTGTEGATLRVYLERHEPDPARHDLPLQQALAPLAALAEAVARIRHHTDRDQPDVMT